MTEALHLTSGSPADTEALGTALAGLLAPGDVVLLVGEVGAGKTTLTRAVARALGVRGPVTSPTFALAQSYAGRVPVLHIDAYRLGAADDEELGLLLDGAGEAVTLIEWPDSLAGALPAPRLVVRLDHAGGDRRDIRLEPDPALLDPGLLRDHLRARHIDAESLPRPHPR